MNIELEKEDLVAMVMGTTPGYSHINKLQELGLGSFTGGFKEEWNWNKTKLLKLSDEQLLNLYKCFSSVDYTTVNNLLNYIQQDINNKGWTKISSRDELPKNMLGYTFVHTSDGETYNLGQLITWPPLYNNKNITHYRVVGLFESPI